MWPNRHWSDKAAQEFAWEMRNVSKKGSAQSIHFRRWKVPVTARLPSWLMTTVEAAAVESNPCCLLLSAGRSTSDFHLIYKVWGFVSENFNAGLFPQPSKQFQELPKILILFWFNHLDWIQLFATKATNQKGMRKLSGYWHGKNHQV